MKPVLPVLLLAVSLGGCASLPHPAFLHRHHHKAATAVPVPEAAPVIVAPAPVPAAPPPTFGERFHSRWKRLKWTH